MKRKSSGKTVVFKSLCLAFEGSNTNTGTAGPITKARVKRKSKKALKYFQQSWGRGGDRQLQKKNKVSHLLGVYQQALGNERHIGNKKEWKGNHSGHLSLFAQPACIIILITTTPVF